MKTCPLCAAPMEYLGEDHLSESGEMYYVKVYECTGCKYEFDQDELDNYAVEPTTAPKIPTVEG